MIAVALVVAGIAANVPAGMDHEGVYALLAGLFGAVVGASELVSRYRDEPTRALTSAAGLTYMLMNGIVSGLAFGLLTRYAIAMFPGLANDPLMRSVVAGFGAMAVLRSKFFTLRTAKGEDVSVGPDAAVSAFLDAADRGVDRSRAARRLALVFDEASRVDRPEDGPDFLEISVAALQNLSVDDKTRFVERINSVVGSQYSDRLKLQAICYELLTLTGERNFSEIMANLETYVRSAPPASHEDASVDEPEPPAPGAAGG